MAPAVNRTNALLAIRMKVQQMSQEEAEARFASLRDRLLLADEFEECLLLAERLGAAGAIWHYSLRDYTWRPGRAPQ